MINTYHYTPAIKIGDIIVYYGNIHVFNIVCGDPSRVSAFPFLLSSIMWGVMS